MRYDPLIPMLGIVTMIRTDTPDVKPSSLGIQFIEPM